ncbi:3-deoxy-D-manno-octulosonic acid transferase [Candidatus Pelagibacter sp. HIMB1623]|uniref:3-deoxy-D-manno-octulosonic acid transferase n=1 Tax=unclassified Candidatus Pelagibacter TaxID=2647897 RepID=UPI003F82924A
MYFVYNFFLYIVFLLSPIILLVRILKGKEDPKRFKEKLCIYSKKNNLKSIWFHAVSVGELMSIIPVLKILEKDKKIDQIIVTTSTISSATIFEKYKFKKIVHKYFPIDTNFLNKKFIKYWKPKATFFVDSEIWPNMFKNLKKNNIPVILLNGRITNRSFKRWSLVKNFSKSVFKNISLALPSNLETKNFLKKLGVNKIKFIGNLKYYGLSKVKNKDKKFLKNKFKNFKVWCAASTHEGEEIIISKLHKNIKRKQKNLLTVIIPRHINRVTKIIEQIKTDELKIIKHSSNTDIKKNTDIYIVDTYGEASKFYNLSNVCFMGGSIINHGGQNPLEPSRLGNYIINGPNIRNFKEIYEFLSKNNMSTTTSNISKIQKIIEKKLNKKISNLNKTKIIKIGEKILNGNMIYINKYIK